MNRSEIFEILRGRLNPTGDALEVLSNGAERWRNLIGWGSTDLKAAGWLNKSGTGVWSITDAGRQALHDHPDPYQLRQVAQRAYSRAVRQTLDAQGVARSRRIGTRGEHRPSVAAGGICQPRRQPARVAPRSAIVARRR